MRTLTLNDLSKSLVVCALGITSVLVSFWALPAHAKPQQRTSASNALAATAPKSVSRASDLSAIQPEFSVEGLDSYRLKNGMQVILAADDSKPTVTINLTYRVGSRHENYGETGMAHLLEHMLFKGTPRFPNVWAEFDKRGMRANGTTWTDRTNYFASFASDPKSVDWYLRWLADAMTNSTISKAELDKEMTVVRNEMESGENNTFRVLIEALMASAYRWHNYGKSTIGARADVEGVDIDRLKAFYKLYYQPDNAVLIISGKFDNKQVMELIRTQFATIPAPTRKLPKVVTIDPVQDGERAVTVKRPAGAPLIIVSYHMPPAGHPDMAAVDLLEEVLGDTPSGRIHKALVDTKLAAQGFAFGFKFEEPGLSFFGAQLAKDGDVEKAKAALLKVLDDLQSQPITAEELERARTKWLKSWDLRFTDPEEIGVALSEAIALGDWRMFFLRRDQIKALKLEDLNRVARERLVVDNRTVGVFLPTDKPVRAPAPARFDVAASVKDYRGGPAIARGEAFEASAENIDRRSEVVTLMPGVRAALLPKKTRGAVVSLQIQMHVGSLERFQELGAVPATAMALLDRGSKTMTRTQISDAFDKLKTEAAIGGGLGVLSINLLTTRENLDKALALAIDVARNPVYPDDQLEEFKTQAITAIRRAEKEPDGIGRNALARHLNTLPKSDPRYAGSFDEQVERVRSVTAQQLRDFHQRFVGVSDVYVSVVGDFDVAALKAQLPALLANWKTDEPVKRIPAAPLKTQAANLKFETPDKQNAYFGMRLPIKVGYGTPEHAALMVADQIFGASQNSRLWVRLREKDGLSYGVGSGLQVDPFEPAGMYSAGGIYAPQNLAKFRAGFEQELQRVLKDGFTDKEVSEAISSILRDRQLNRAQDPAVASGWILRMRMNRTWKDSSEFENLLKNVTAQSALEAFRKHIKPELMAFAVGGDFAKHGQ